MSAKLADGTELVLKRGEYITVPNDNETFVPAEFVGFPIAPNQFCRFWNQKRAKYCRARAGWGTRHKRVGRCKKHDGGSDKRTTHGLKNLYKVGNATMLEAIDRHASDPTLLDMRTELAIVCALLDEVLAKDDFDRLAVERLAVEASRLKERIHNTSAKNAFSVEQMKRFWFALNRVIEHVLKDEPALCAKLQEQITLIPL